MKKALCFVLLLLLLLPLVACTEDSPGYIKVVDDDGDIISISTNTGALLVGDFALEVALGNVPGASIVNKFGRNTDVDTGGTLGRDIWDGGIGGAADWVPPTAARIHQIASTSANDDTDGGGTNAGAHTVQILGLDADYLLTDEIITLDGISNVATSNTYTMIHRMVVQTAGATGWNEGTITATANSDNTVTAQITIAFNQTQMAIYMIPGDKRGIVTQFWGNINKKGGATPLADVLAFVKPFDGVWQLKVVSGVTLSGTSSFYHTFIPPPIFSSKTLLKVKAQPSANNLDISAGFNVILVPN